jgi:hypothetical protein
LARQTQEKLSLLQSHPLNLKVKFNYMSQGFLFEVDSKKKIKMQGFKPVLSKVFWPNYVYTRTKYSESTGVSSSQEGLERGKIVHKQIQDYYTLSSAAFLKKYGDIHPYAKKAIAALKKWGYLPWKSEFKIVCKELRIATAIDLIATKNGKLCLIEFKTGQDGYINVGNSNMIGPESLSKKYSNCPLHQAYLQVLLSAIILDKVYGVKVDECLVVHIQKEMTTPYVVPTDLVKISDDIITAIARYRINADKAKAEKKKRKRVTKKKTTPKEETPKKRKKSA